MRTYLKVVNPIVSLLVLLVCLYSSTVEDGDFEALAPVEGSFAAYFVAKGLFCSSALFLLGKILEHMLYGRTCGKGNPEDDAAENT
jgi:hypothetical protein